MSRIPLRRALAALVAAALAVPLGTASAGSAGQVISLEVPALVGVDLTASPADQVEGNTPLTVIRSRVEGGDLITVVPR